MIPGARSASEVQANVRFWQHPIPPDPEVVARFLQQLKNLTQMPASIYAGRRQDLAWP